MPVINCDSRPQVIYRGGSGPGLIVNTDTANPAYIGLDKGLSRLSDQLPAQASIAVDGDRDVWASTLNTAITVALQAMPGATEWDNPVGVQIALNALGLAKDTSVQATTTAVGGLPAGIAGSALPGNIGTAAVAAGLAKDTSVAGVTTAVGGLPAGIAGSALPGNIGTAAVAAGLAKDTSVTGVTTAVGGLPAGIAGSALPGNIGSAAVAAGLAKDTSVTGLPAGIASSALPGNIGTAAVAAGLAKDTSVAGVSTAVGALHASGKTIAAEVAETSLTGTGLAKDTSVAAVQTALGSPAQDTTVAGVGTAVGALHAAGKTIAGDLATTSLAGTGLAKDTSVAAVQTALGSPAQDGSVSALANSVPAGIAISGAPLRAAPTLLASPGSQIWTSGQVRTYGPYSVSQIGYEIAVRVEAAASEPAIPCMVLALTWTDSASGQTVSVERWYLSATNTGVNTYSGVGRAKGDTLTVSMTWGGAFSSQACQIIITTSSRIYVRDDFRSLAFFGEETIQNGAYDLPGGIILSTGPTVSGTLSRSMPLYCGSAMIFASAPTAAATISIANQQQANNQNLPCSVVAYYELAAGVPIYEELVLPRSNCVLTFQSTTSQLIQCVITIREQET